jgi:4a-hydroxytetrahydrobiopterin dehydratase
MLRWGAMAGLAPDEIDRRLAALPGWRRTPEGIRKTWVMPNFRAALAFAGWVGELAEAADHHPDILIHRYKRVTLTLLTHSEGAVTEKDVALAASIEGEPRA